MQMALRDLRRLTAITAGLVLVSGVLLIGASATGLIARGSQITVTANVAPAADDAAAEAVLNHSLPQIRDLSAGLRRSALTISPALTANIPRHVNQSYALGSRNMALLTVSRSNLGHVDGAETLVGGHATYVASRVIFDGTTDVSYDWEFEGLAHTLHVNLIGGLSRSDADRIAASVR